MCVILAGLFRQSKFSFATCVYLQIKANTDWQTKLTTLWCSPPLKTNKTQHLPLNAPPSPKECTQYPSSFTYLTEANHTWHFPYAQSQACSSRGHSKFRDHEQRTLFLLSGSWTTKYFLCSLELSAIPAWAQIHQHLLHSLTSDLPF